MYTDSLICNRKSAVSGVKAASLLALSCECLYHSDTAERIGFAVNNAGIDVISGLYDNAAGKEAYERATNGYYDTHTLPEGITPEMVTLSDEVLDRAVSRTLTEMFRLGMFEDTYRDAKAAGKNPSYDAKLEAIGLFLKEKGGNLDEELDHFMDALYKKYVPQQVREFIEKKEAEAAQTAP